jgi:hypothetical protein
MIRAACPVQIYPNTITATFNFVNPVFIISGFYMHVKPWQGSSLLIVIVYIKKGIEHYYKPTTFQTQMHLAISIGLLYL